MGFWDVPFNLGLSGWGERQEKETGKVLGRDHLSNQFPSRTRCGLCDCKLAVLSFCRILILNNKNSHSSLDCWGPRGFLACWEWRRVLCVCVCVFHSFVKISLGSTGMYRKRYLSVWEAVFLKAVLSKVRELGSASHPDSCPLPWMQSHLVVKGRRTCPLSCPPLPVLTFLGLQPLIQSHHSQKVPREISQVISTPLLNAFPCK